MDTDAPAPDGIAIFAQRQPGDIFRPVERGPGRALRLRRPPGVLGRDELDHLPLDTDMVDRRGIGPKVAGDLAGGREAVHAQIRDLAVIGVEGGGGHVPGHIHGPGHQEGPGHGVVAPIVHDPQDLFR